MANYKPVQNMATLYDKFRSMLAPSYTPQSASSIKDTISRAIRNDYDKQITQRIDTGKANRGEIIAEAGGRGMGTSSALSDRLMRAKDAEARDISNIESDYNAQVNSMLLNKLNAQDELAMTENNQIRNAALGLAQGMYGKVFGKHGSGGGGWGGRSPRDPKDPIEPPFEPPITPNLSPAAANPRRANSNSNLGSRNNVIRRNGATVSRNGRWSGAWNETR